MSFNAEVQNINEGVVTYAPVAIQAVQAIESAASGLPGQTKLEIATAVVMASANAAANVPVPQVQAVASLISLIVGIFNATGVFKKKAKAVA